jgi:hypothetical protein
MAFDPQDAESKKAIKDAVEAAVTEATSGLVAKNQELIGKLKKAQKDSTISPEDHAALQAELDTTTAKLTEAVKLAKTATTEAEKIKKAYESESKVAHDLLVKQGLSTALLANGVKNPAYLEAAEALLYGKVVLTADGENRVAKVGDKPLADFVKEWAVSDKGKAFVEAPGNSGGGAHGGGAGTAAMTGLEKMSPEARLSAINAAGKAA